ncbi:hypothetical protein [Hypericibacter sp.]|uniref:hypothetical protein n=1 Tax=Hypericibacter sp. TaxID=2705401 RepID=UPI003D6DA072
MTADDRSELEPTPQEPAVPSRRQLLQFFGWGLLPAAAVGLASCEAPTYDSNRGVFVMHPRK